MSHLEVDTRYLRLATTFNLMDRQRSLAAGDIRMEDELIELQSHYARYLCVLVAGFTEQSVKVLVREFAETHLPDHSRTIFERRVRGSFGMNSDRLEEFIRFLDTALWLEFENKCFRELQALSSVTSQRNKIAHGDDSDITLPQVKIHLADLHRLVLELRVALSKVRNASS